MIFMLLIGDSDLGIEVGKGLLQELELAGDELNTQSKALKDDGLIGDGQGRADQGQALVQKFLAA